jgi:hypothetical protein
LAAPILLVHFLLAQKTNQKRAPKMTTSNCPYARYTCLIGATGQSEVGCAELADFATDLKQDFRAARFAPFGFAELAELMPNSNQLLILSLGFGLPSLH